MIEMLPAVNASLNGLAAVILVAGWIAIRKKAINIHKWCMITAFGVSALFLASYVTYHLAKEGVSTPFPGQGIWRPIYYYVILIPHIILAVGMLPPIFITLYRAYRGDFERHRWIARWTLPIWLYVSVTGVIVYLMLYQIDWVVE